MSPKHDMAVAVFATIRVILFDVACAQVRLENESTGPFHGRYSTK